MIRMMIETMLGPWGRAALNFYFEHQTLLNILFLIWAFIMTYASLQLRDIRTRTVRLAVQLCTEMPQLSGAALWSAFEPQWHALFEQKKYIVPNRWNIWVQTATPEHMVLLMRLGPDWMDALRKGEVLRNHLELPGARNTPLKDYQK